MKTVFNLKNLSVMKNYIKYICVLLLLGLSTSAWAGTVTLTYNYNSDYNDMWYGNMEDASGGQSPYWKITETALFSVPITEQPTSNITISIKLAYFGNGNEGLEKISVKGTETSSNWTMGETSACSHSGTTYSTCTFTVTKPANPTTLEGLDITLNRKTGKSLRVQKIEVSYTAATTASIIVKESGSQISSINFGTVTTDNGYKTINLSGTCLTTDDNYYNYFYVSISGTDADNFNAAAATYGFVYNSPEDISVSYEDLTEARTYTATLTITAYKASECAQYYEGESFTRDIPLSVTYDPPCTSRNITMSDFSKSYGAADFVPTHTVSAGGGTKTWTSSNTNVATIVSGQVHIVGAGSTTITLSVAASGGYCAVSKSCTMTVNAVAPTVSDFTVTSYTNNKITVSNANASQITNKGGANITRYGYIYSTTASTTSTLTFGASGVNDANVGTNNIELNTKYAAKDITGLSAGTTYYVRAYAYNGSAYGYSSAIRTVTTKCAVTYAANGGTGSTTDASSPYEKLSDVTVLANGFTPPSGKKFVDWLGSDANHYNPNDVINDISTDMTLTAQWDDVTYKDYVFACVDISVASAAAGKALVTSRKDVNVMATNPIKVTITGAVAGHRVTFTNSVGLKFYKKVEGTGDDAGKYKYVEAIDANSFVTPLTNQEVYVSYNPTSDGTGAVLSALPFTISCDGESQEFNTDGEYVKARNLPNAIAIVTKVGSTWQALPANMGATGVNPKPVIVNVATTGGVLTASGPSTLGYKLWPVKTVVSTGDRFGTATSTGFPAALYGDRLRFAGVDNHGLWANDSKTENKIKNDAQITAISDGGESAYEWKVTTTEEDGQFVYTLQTDQTNNDYYLRLWGSKWGTYDDSHGQAEVYILPLVPTETADVTVMEWGTNMIAVKYANAGTVASGTFKARIGTADQTTVTCASLGGDIYKLTGVGDLQSNPAKTLTLNMTETSTAKQAVFAIPLIVTDSKTEAQLCSYAAGGNGSTLITEGRKIAKGLDVIIRSGGTLTTGTAQGKFANLYIYPGGKVEFTNNIEFSNIYLRGGFSWLDAEKDYRLPQMKVDEDIMIDGVQSTGNGVYYDLYLDKRRYYMMAVPKDVTLESMTDEEGGDDATIWLKQYSGKGRTQTPKVSGWVNISGNKLLRGVGYEMSIKPRNGRTIGILRMPLLQATAWTNEGECTPAVKAWGYNDENVMANNKGWNFIGNPYFTAFQVSAADGTVMEVRDMVEHKPDGEHWDGTWDWTTSEDVKYVTIPCKMYDDYVDERALNFKLESFYPFFIQAKLDGNLTFTGSPVLKAPSLLRKAVAAREIMIDFSISDGNGTLDKAGLTISDDYSVDFDMEDKEKTIANNDYLKIYTMVGEYRTAFNSLPEAAAALPIPVGYIAPTNGEYTISLQENGDYSKVKHVYLTDYTTAQTVDLLTAEEGYTFETETGEINNRLALNVILKGEEDDPPIVTDLEGIDSDYNVPVKFIYQDKMYIRYRGVIFDAVGKKVSEINK